MTKTLFLVAALGLAAACGGAQTPEPATGTSPETPTATSPATPSPGATATGMAPSPSSSPTSPGADGGAPSQTGIPAAPTGPMKPVSPTEMAAQLKDLGLDVKNLPPLNKIPPDKIRKVMGTFTKALGTTCTGCHDGDDFKKPTPNKKVAARMWNEFVRGYAIAPSAGGGAVYCDSCHAGKMTFLVRDPGLKQISEWMDQNYVGRLAKTNHQPHSCETCHGDPMEGKFLENWRK